MMGPPIESQSKPNQASSSPRTRNKTKKPKSKYAKDSLFLEQKSESNQYTIVDHTEESYKIEVRQAPDEGQDPDMKTVQVRSSSLEGSRQEQKQDKLHRELGQQIERPKQQQPQARQCKDEADFSDKEQDQDKILTQLIKQTQKQAYQKQVEVKKEQMKCGNYNISLNGQSSVNKVNQKSQKKNQISLNTDKIGNEKEKVQTQGQFDLILTFSKQIPIPTLAIKLILPAERTFSSVIYSNNIPEGLKAIYGNDLETIHEALEQNHYTLNLSNFVIEMHGYMTTKANRKIKTKCTIQLEESQRILIDQCPKIEKNVEVQRDFSILQRKLKEISKRVVQLQRKFQSQKPTQMTEKLKRPKILSPHQSSESSFSQPNDQLARITSQLKAMSLQLEKSRKWQQDVQLFISGELRQELDYIYSQLNKGNKTILTTKTEAANKQVKSAGSEEGKQKEYIVITEPKIIRRDPQTHLNKKPIEMIIPKSSRFFDEPAQVHFNYEDECEAGNNRYYREDGYYSYYEPGHSVRTPDRHMKQSHYAGDEQLNTSQLGQKKPQVAYSKWATSNHGYCPPQNQLPAMVRPNRTGFNVMGSRIVYTNEGKAWGQLIGRAIYEEGQDLVSMKVLKCAYNSANIGLGIVSCNRATRVEGEYSIFMSGGNSQIWLIDQKSFKNESTGGTSFKADGEIIRMCVNLSKRQISWRIGRQEVVSKTYKILADQKQAWRVFLLMKNAGDEVELIH